MCHVLLWVSKHSSLPGYEVERLMSCIQMEKRIVAGAESLTCSNILSFPRHSQRTVRTQWERLKWNELIS